MQTQLSACGNNEHGTFTEKEKQHTNICHFFKQTNGDLRQIFTDRSNCSILPSPNELKNVLSVCAFDSVKWNVYLTRLEKRLFPDCSEFASRCYRYVCDQLTTIEAVVDVFEFIKCSWPGNNKILDRLADRLIDEKILASTLFQVPYMNRCKLLEVNFLLMKMQAPSFISIALKWPVLELYYDLLEA